MEVVWTRALVIRSKGVGKGPLGPLFYALAHIRLKLRVIAKHFQSFPPTQAQLVLFSTYVSVSPTC